MGAPPFYLPKPFWPLNWGIQAMAVGDGGPSGFENARAYHAAPWPNRPAQFVDFTSPWPYGTATTLARNPNIPNLWSGHSSPYPLGYQKPLTGAGFSF